MKIIKAYAAALLLGLTLATAGACASTATHESTGGYIDDSVITAKVKTAIFNDPALKVFQINVKTYKGTVQLSGFVDSEAAAKKAVEVAGKVPGVQSVKNDMQIK
ncbi:BON domain-containing protein [Mangrovitalea sediminis]|nr:BON domain-containing protein [Mangrovitalea sediminis]